MAAGRSSVGKKVAVAEPAATKTVAAPVPAPIEASKPVSGGDRGLGALAYWGPLVIAPLVKRKKTRFLAFHTRQGLYLFGAAVAAVLVTLALLFLFDQTSGRDSPFFLVFSVILLLEMVAYAILVVTLSLQALRSRMAMLPLLGDLAGEG